MKTHIKNYTFSTAALLVFLFCNFLGLCTCPLSFPSPASEPTRADIVGIWEMTPDTIQTMQEKGRYEISTHTIEFKDDGTFEITNMPDWWALENFGESTQTFYSGSGRWTIEKDSGGWAVGLYFDTWTGSHPMGKTWLNLRGRLRPHTIYTWIGDPDAGNIIEFHKR
jgi:hypothetical protein